MLRLKAFLLGIAVFVNGFSFSQNLNEFVEVIVEDSISLVPQEIIFSVYIIPDYGEGVPDTGSGVEIKANQAKYEAIATELQELIKRQNINKIATSKWAINGTYNDYQPKLFMQLKFNSLEKLESFITAASKIKKVHGFISSVSSSLENQYKQKLYKRLIEKAREDAGSLAGHAARKLGSLIQAREEEAMKQNAGGWTAYPPLSALGLSDNDLTDSSVITIYKKLVVRFSW